MEKKVKPWIWLVLLAIGVLAVFLYFFKNHFPETTIKLKGQTLRVLVAKTFYQQHLGLGGRNSLYPYDGMIFLSEAYGKPTMVMRDMKFPIDIVWFSDGRVVDIAPSVPTEDLPEDRLTKYYPRQEANLVLELPAGWAEENGLRIGDKLELPQ